MLFSKLEFQSNSNSALTCRLAVRIRVCVAEPVGSAAALISALVRPATRAIDVRIRHRWPLQVNHFEQFNAPPVAISVKSFKNFFYEWNDFERKILKLGSSVPKIQMKRRQSIIRVPDSSHLKEKKNTPGEYADELNGNSADRWTRIKSNDDFPIYGSRWRWSPWSSFQEWQIDTRKCETLNVTWTATL